MRVRDAWGRFTSWLFRDKRPWKATQVEDLPDELKPRTVYVLGEGRHVWSIAMCCPCGCGETIHLNALPGTRPRWRMRRHRDSSVTLHPSVWRNSGCRSHFLLRGGHIVWCRGFGEQDTGGGTRGRGSRNGGRGGTRTSGVGR
jgi:hypothetical protein